MNYVHHSLERNPSMLLRVLQWLHLLVFTRCYLVFDEGNQHTKDNAYCGAYGGCLPGTHVMCMYEKGMGARCTEPKALPLNEEERQHVLDILNEMRRNLAQGQDKELPKAYGMRKLFWDTELAKFAQAWANQCDSNRLDLCRNTDQYPRVGQTLISRRFDLLDWSVRGDIPSNVTYTNVATESKDDMYHVFHVPTDKSIWMFKVRAPGEVQIALAVFDPNSLVHTELQKFEIFIGTEGNSKSLIQSSSVLDRADTPEILSAVEFRGFWIRWDNGVTVGYEGQDRPFLRTPPTNKFTPSYIAIRTPKGTTGNWKIEGNVTTDLPSDTRIQMPEDIKMYVIEEFAKAINSKGSIPSTYIEKFPKDYRSPYLLVMYSQNSKVGCGMSSYVEFYRDSDRNPVIYNMVQVVCNFAIEPVAGDRVYETKLVDGQDLTPCGCPKGFYEDQCLCVSGGPSENQTEPSEEQTDPNEKQTDPSENQTEPSQKQTDPTETQTNPNETQTDPSENQTDPNETQTYPSENQTDPNETQTDPSENQTDPNETQTEPSEKQTDPNETQTEPSEKQTDPNETQTEPSEKQTDSNGKQTDPSKKQTDSSEKQTVAETCGKDCETHVVILPIITVENVKSLSLKEINDQAEPTSLRNNIRRNKEIRDKIKDKVEDVRDRYFKDYSVLEPGATLPDGDPVDENTFVLSKTNPKYTSNMNYKRIKKPLPNKKISNVEIKARKDFSDLDELVAEYILKLNEDEHLESTSNDMSLRRKGSTNSIQSNTQISKPTYSKLQNRMQDSSYSKTTYNSYLNYPELKLKGIQSNRNSYIAKEEDEEDIVDVLLDSIQSSNKDKLKGDLIDNKDFTEKDLEEILNVIHGENIIEKHENLWQKRNQNPLNTHAYDRTNFDYHLKFDNKQAYSNIKPQSMSFRDNKNDKKSAYEYSGHNRPLVNDADDIARYYIEDFDTDTHTGYRPNTDNDMRLRLNTGYDNGHRLDTGYDTGHRLDTRYDTGHRLDTGYDAGHRLDTGYDTEHRLNTGYDTEHRLNTGYDKGHPLDTGYDNGHRLATWYDNGHRLDTGYDTGHRLGTGYDTGHRLDTGYDIEHRLDTGYDTEQRLEDRQLIHLEKKFSKYQPRPQRNNHDMNDHKQRYFVPDRLII